MTLILSQQEKDEIKRLMRSAAKIAGSQYRLAKELHVAKSSISNLVNGKFLPSARVCVLIEGKYGINKEKLRPDIFLFS